MSSGIPASASLPAVKMVPRDSEELSDTAENESLPLDPTSPRKSSLAEILRSDPPWGEQARGATPSPVRMRSASISPTGPSRMPVLGRPIAPSLARPVDPPFETHVFLSSITGRSEMKGTGQPPPITEVVPKANHADDAETTAPASPRKRSSAADLADFFRNTAPPANDAGPASPEPTQSQKKSDTAELADPFKNTAPPNANQPSPKSKPGRIRSMLARVISRESDDPKQSLESRTTSGRTSRLGSSDDNVMTGMGTRDTFDKADPFNGQVFDKDLINGPASSVGSEVDKTSSAALRASSRALVADAASLAVSSSGVRPKTLAKHQILVFDPSEQSSVDTDIPLVGRLRAILSPYYTVGLILGRSLRRDPWEATCALLVVVSDDVSGVTSDPILREKISEFLQSEGKIWAVGEVAGMFCQEHTLSDRKLLQTGLLISASVRTSASGLLVEDVPRKNGPQPVKHSAVFFDEDTGAIQILRRLDAEEAIVAIGSTCGRGQVVLWTLDFSYVHGSSNQDEICVSALNYLGIQPISPVAPTTAKSHWSGIDPRLLQPKQQLPVILLSHPELDSQLASKIFEMPELDANASAGSIEQESDVIPTKIIKDSENTFTIYDLLKTRLDVPNFMDEARNREADESDAVVSSPAISMILASHTDASRGWQHNWTPLFDFEAYWKELDSVSKQQGVVRKRNVGSVPGELEPWSIGDLVQYGEAVGSTQTMLDK